MDIHFTIEKQPEAIRDIVELCDASFMVGITHRENYTEILNKMQNYAEFIVPRSAEEIPLGYVSMYANNAETKRAYISMFCIRKEFQNQHLGKALMDKAAKIAREKGMETIQLEVLRDNIKGQNFYLKFGFQVKDNSNCSSMFMEYIL